MCALAKAFDASASAAAASSGPMSPLLSRLSLEPLCHPAHAADVGYAVLAAPLLLLLWALLLQPLCRCCRRRAYRRKLVRYYEQHNRAKLADIDRLLDSAGGNYAALFRRVREKYEGQVSHGRTFSYAKAAAADPANVAAMGVLLAQLSAAAQRL